MCFRPAGVDQSVDCPECGKMVNAILGVFPDTCPFCGFKYDIEALSADAPAAPNVPGAPKMPSAPGSAGLPGAAPKPPSAPGSSVPPKTPKPS